jgi:hypothetical protein
MANYVARFDSFFAITDHHLAAAIWPFIENVSIPKLGFALQDALSPPAPSALNLVAVPSLASILRQRRSTAGARRVSRGASTEAPGTGLRSPCVGEVNRSKGADSTINAMCRSRPLRDRVERIEMSIRRMRRFSSPGRSTPHSSPPVARGKDIESIAGRHSILVRSTE